MKRTYLIVFVGGLLMSIVTSLGELKRTNANNAVLIFIITFATWAIFFGLFILAIRLYTKPDLESGEIIQKAEWGSCYSDDGLHGGIIYLTAKRLIFKSHFLNKDKQYEKIVFHQDIEDVTKNGKGFGISTKQGYSVMFFMNDTKEWVEKINQNIT